MKNATHLDVCVCVCGCVCMPLREDHHNMLERKTNVLMEQYFERQVELHSKVSTIFTLYPPPLSPPSHSPFLFWKGLKYKAVLHKWSGLTSAQISDLVTKW